MKAIKTVLTIAVAAQCFAPLHVYAQDNSVVAVDRNHEPTVGEKLSPKSATPALPGAISMGPSNAKAAENLKQIQKSVEDFKARIIVGTLGGLGLAGIAGLTALSKAGFEALKTLLVGGPSSFFLMTKDAVRKFDQHIQNVPQAAIESTRKSKNLPAHPSDRTDRDKGPSIPATTSSSASS